MTQSGIAVFNVCPSASHLPDYFGITQTGPALPGQLGGQRLALRWTQEDQDQMTHLPILTRNHISPKRRELTFGQAEYNVEPHFFLCLATPFSATKTTNFTVVVAKVDKYTQSKSYSYLK